MGIRFAVSHAAAGALAVAVAVAAGSGDAYAQANVLKECGSQYQAAKAANELGGQSWQEFLKACRARLAEQANPETPAAVAPPPEAPPPAAAETKPTPPPPPAEPTPPPAVEAKPVAPPAPEAAPAPPPVDTKAAARERQKKCGAEWKSNKRELKKANPKITWPKFLSECNKRLKDAGE